jgi:hypothetical protein
MENKQNTGIIKKILKILGIIILVILLLLILLLGALAIIKPYGIDITKVIPALLDKDTTNSYDHPYLTTQQENLLKSIGVEPEDIPTQITPGQEQCAVETLGQEKVNEIKAGSTPSITDILKLKTCLD